MKIYKTKNFGVRAKKINFFTFGPKKPLRGLTYLGSGPTKNTFLKLLLFDLCRAEKML